MATILIIDDSTYSLDVLRYLLEDRGHHVILSADGAGALEALQCEWPDLVVSDLILPDIDGADLLRRIRAMPGGDVLPVVAISAMSNRLHEAAPGEPHFDACLDKPVIAKELLEVVDTLLSLPTAAPRTLLATGTPLHVPSPSLKPCDPGDDRCFLELQIDRLRRLNEELSRRCSVLTDNFRAVASLVDSISDSSDLESLLEHGMRDCLDAVRAPRAILYLADEATGELRYRVGYGYARSSEVENCFGHLPELALALGRNQTVELRDLALTRDPGAVAVAVPLLLPRPAGVFVVVMPEAAVHDERLFAVRAMAGQIGQSLALTRALSRSADSERTTRLLLDSTCEAVFGLDMEGRCVFANHAGQRLVHCAGVPLHERPLLDVCRPTRPDGQSLSAEECPVSQALLYGVGSEVADLVLVRSDGTTFPADVSSYPTVDDGRRTGCVVVIKDISGHKRAEEMLATRARQQAALAGLCKNALAGVSLAHLFEETVEQVRCFLAVDAVAILELVGQSRLEGRAGVGWGIAVTDPHFAATSEDCMLFAALGQRQALVALGDVDEDGCPVRRRQVLLEHCLVSSAVVLIGDHERPFGVLEAHCRSPRVFDEGDVHFLEAVANVLGVACDRRAAERAVRRSEEYFRALIENSHELVMVLGREGLIRYASPCAGRFFGVSPSDLAGQNLGRFSHPDDGLPWTYEAGQQRVLHIEMRLCNQQGEWRVLEGASYDCVDDPAVEGIILNVRDVTDRRQAEDALRESEMQLRQTQKMDAVGKLAGGVAHDFNNLLTAITGYTELLLRDFAPDDPRVDFIKELQNAGTRAASLTRQLLAFSRRQMTSSRVLDANQIVANMEKMLARLIGEDIQLIVTRDPKLWRIKADPGQIEQVILNLAVNARDAMPQGGGLYITTANVTLEEHHLRAHPESQPGPFVMLAVGDTGCGMDAETLVHIFEPFFTTKENGKGTGLGLSTVYGVVKQGGGFIDVSSAVGKGTIFKAYFPQVPDAQEVPVVAPVGDAAHGSETILLVEDELSVRKLAGAILRHSGYQLLEAADGVEALRLCREFDGQIDLLLTDVVMPRMSGRVLAEHVLRLKPKTRVLYASGYTDDAVLRHGVMVERAAFLQKPFRPDVLMRKVRDVLDAGRTAFSGCAASQSA